MLMARKAADCSDPFSQDAPLTTLIWPAIAHAMLAEVRSGATEEQARGFFQALGQRIATLMPVDDIDDLDTFGKRVNLLWEQLGWGNVLMSLNGNGIDLRHDRVPHMPPPGDDSAWLSATGPLLEGAYDSWFKAMGSNARFHTRVTHQSEGCFELRHAP